MKGGIAARGTRDGYDAYNVDLLQESYYALKHHAAIGVDGQRWQQ